MNLLNIKAKLAALGAIALAAIAAILRISYLKNQRDSLKDRARTLDAQLKQRAEVDEADAEIEATFSRRAKEARRVLDEGGIPDHLRNPND